MIPKKEILDIATKLKLLPSIIEKDYLLGWLLAGIANHEELKKAWVFKGGTALKKCYFDKYRFSEDLDFTLTSDFSIKEDLLKNIFVQISNWIYSNSGIEIPHNRIKFENYTNPRGNISCTGSIYCRGPITPKGNYSLQRIKLDLTSDELIVDLPITKTIFHEYSDHTSSFHVLCYSYLEIFAEKIRALWERTRPRDLYDVIHLYKKLKSDPIQPHLKEFIIQKFNYKNLPSPKMTTIELHKKDCQTGWNDQLSHQLPHLEEFNFYWGELGAFFEWLG